MAVAVSKAGHGPMETGGTSLNGLAAVRGGCLGETVRELRLAAGTKQNVLAARAGMTKQQWSRIERSGSFAHADTIERIAVALEADPAARALMMEFCSSQLRMSSDYGVFLEASEDAGSAYRRLRVDSGLSQLALATRMGVDDSLISHMERGSAPMTRRVFRLFNRALWLDTFEIAQLNALRRK